MSKRALAHLKINDPALYVIAIRVLDLIVIQPFTPQQFFESLCDHIISQQLAGKAAETIFNRFKTLSPNGKISPEGVLALSDEKLREVGLSRAKASYIKDLAQKVMNKELVLEKLPELSDEEVITHLTKVKGIGRWTAEMFLMFNLGREDVFSYGDLGLMNAIIKLYKIEGKPTREQLEKLEANWKPYRSFASRVLWKSLTLK